MKSAEEYLEEEINKLHASHQPWYDNGIYDGTSEPILKAIKSAQSDAIDATCKRCAENVKFCTESFVDKDGLWDTREINEIDLNSIYEVADKMKEEING